MQLLSFIYKMFIRCRYLKNTLYVFAFVFIMLVTFIILGKSGILLQKFPEEWFILLSPIVPYLICQMLFNTIIPSLSNTISFWLTVPQGFFDIYKRTFIFSIIIFFFLSFLLILVWSFSYYILLGTLIVFNIWLFNVLVLVVELQPLDPYSKFFYKKNLRILGYNILTAFPILIYFYLVDFSFRIFKIKVPEYRWVLYMLVIFSILNIFIVIKLAKKCILNNKSRVYIRLKL